MKIITKINMTILALVSGGLLTIAIAPHSGAIELFDECKGGGASDTKVCEAEKTDNVDTVMKNIVSILLYFIGAVAAIMIVIGGIKYSTANGDKTKIEEAKNTLLYAVIGLVAAISGQALVLFVVDWF